MWQLIGSKGIIIIIIIETVLEAHTSIHMKKEIIEDRIHMHTYKMNKQTRPTSASTQIIQHVDDIFRCIVQQLMQGL